uniref:POPLD domain-containing protein n=1 Tax=Macrostomum lignano TaxID=282301 RepID=A0A1I8FQ37_9PLAT
FIPEAAAKLASASGRPLSSRRSTPSFFLETFDSVAEVDGQKLLEDAATVDACWLAAGLLANPDSHCCVLLAPPPAAADPAATPTWAPRQPRTKAVRFKKGFLSSGCAVARRPKRCGSIDRGLLRTARDGQGWQLCERDTRFLRSDGVNELPAAVKQPTQVTDLCY